MLNRKLSETFGEVTWKYKIDELITKLLNTLNELINKGYSKTTDLLNEFNRGIKQGYSGDIIIVENDKNNNKNNNIT